MRCGGGKYSHFKLEYWNGVLIAIKKNILKYTFEVRLETYDVSLRKQSHELLLKCNLKSLIFLFFPC